MNQSSRPRKRLVLLGGGHAHVLVLQAFAERPEPGLDLVVISKDIQTPYSGMLPGHVAGLYGRAEMHIDLARLAARAGAQLITDEATGFDRVGRRVLLRTGEPVPYGILSIDIGITPDLAAIPGAREHAIAVKPIGDFLAKWDRLQGDVLAPRGPRRIAIVGAGAAGLCLAFAVTTALRTGLTRQGIDPASLSVTLIGAAAAPELNGGMRRAVISALERHGIPLIAGQQATAIEGRGILLASGRRIPAEVVLIATEAAPPIALRGGAFPQDERGFIAVRPTLQALDDDDVFAAGDCATMLAHPRPKAGVFAVRQGPHLAANLRRRLRHEPLKEMVPQKQHLVLLSTADRRAIAGRGHWLAFEGRWAWWLKDWIDRRFMRRFN
jgi:pyridine nucleotide-disulfide oxidoreductase family protein